MLPKGTALLHLLAIQAELGTHTFNLYNVTQHGLGMMASCTWPQPPSSLFLVGHLQVQVQVQVGLLGPQLEALFLLQVRPLTPTLTLASVVELSLLTSFTASPTHNNRIKHEDSHRSLAGTLRVLGSSIRHGPLSPHQGVFQAIKALTAFFPLAVQLVNHRLSVAAQAS